MEKDRVEIKLNSPTNTYFSGQAISGQICFFVTKKTKIRAIHLQVRGKGKCKWMEMFYKDLYGNVNSRHVFYTGKEVFLNDTVNVPYVPARGIELSPGELSMDFTYLLSKDLPSSFKGNYGSIKYKLKVIIQKPWTFDEKYTIPLTIVKYILSPPITRNNPPQPQICQTTRNVSVFASGPISLVAELPNNFVIRNEKVPLNVTVDNRSSIHVEKLRFTIVQKVSYFSTKPLYNTKIEEVVIFTKETGGVEKKSERSFAHDLLVPTCPPSDMTKIFHVSYKLNVEAILPTFYKNLFLSFVVQVYSSDGNKASGNPFEGSDESGDNAVFPVCNRLSSYISTSSPSHSQIQNESESSSLYSTTSESSTTTLSPAPRAIDLGTLNRGSTRSSIRSSMGYPFPILPGQQPDIPPECRSEYNEIHHPSSTTNNYSPLYGQPAEIQRQILSEINEIFHPPPAMNNSYPPPNVFPTLPHYQNPSVRFEVQARYPINESPPSYEELFGNRRSASPTAPSPETPV